MKFYFVDPMTKTVMCAQDRREFVRLKTPADGLLGANQPAKFFDSSVGPACAFAVQGLHQHAIAGEQVVIDQFGRLIQNLMCGGNGDVLSCFQRCTFGSILPVTANLKGI